MNLTTAPSYEKCVDAINRDPRVGRAWRFFRERAEEITREQMRLCSVPAWPFGEAGRAEYLRDRLAALGLAETHLDAEGNCLALRPGCADAPLTIVSAHLDTVFPAETDFTVRREGGRLYGPGVADDGCGLTGLWALAWALQECAIATHGSLLFVGTVGEEGEGDLRGVRYLLTQGAWAGKAAAFISLDGPGLESIVHIALAARRYRVTWRGAGGHSWGNFGTPNPVNALGRAVAQLAVYPAPSHPRTTFNVGRISGGTGVNVIPAEASCDVDLRSVSHDELRRLDAFFRRVARAATDDENGARHHRNVPLDLTVNLIGDRPGGVTPAEAPIVQLSVSATKLLGFKPRLEISSTDANIPISLGLPAVTFGAGGAGGRMHTPHEWYDPQGRELGLQRALLVILGLAGLAEN